MSERAIRVTREYTPAPGRSVVVESVPAIEVTIGSETRLTFELEVVERVQEIVRHAIGASAQPSLRVTYDAAGSPAAAVPHKAISFAPDVSDLRPEA